MVLFPFSCFVLLFFILPIIIIAHSCASTFLTDYFSHGPSLSVDLRNFPSTYKFSLLLRVPHLSSSCNYLSFLRASIFLLDDFSQVVFLSVDLRSFWSTRNSFLPLSCCVLLFFILAKIHPSFLSVNFSSRLLLLVISLFWGNLRDFWCTHVIVPLF